MRTVYLALLKRGSAAACCLAAIYSFLRSGFFGVLSGWMTSTFATERIPLLLGLDLGNFMKLGLLFIIGFYALSIISYEGEENAGELLGFCMVLYMPELLGLSEVNWFNALGLAHLFNQTRDPWTVLVIGAIIIQAYIFHVVFGDFANLSLKYNGLGVAATDIEAAYSGQLRLAAIFGLFSIASLLGIAAVSSLTSSTLSYALGGFPLRHVVLGILGILITVISLTYYSKGHSGSSE